MRKLKKGLIVVGVGIAAFAVYVEIVNRNSSNMTYRQKVLKAVYPAWMWLNRITGKNRLLLHREATVPNVSFYSLRAMLNNGDTLLFEKFRGRKVLLVNTASDCGYTNQYTGLQELSEKYEDRLQVLAFPANDFKQQENGTDEAIAQFCKKNFGVSFPLMKKSVVLPLPGQHPVYHWLTDPSLNGWNSKAPSWNFSKYLVNEQGVLTDYFDPGVPPDSEKIRKAIEK